MADKGYARVKVSLANGVVTCDPDGVFLFWVDGPDNIWWDLSGLPATVARATVAFATKVPAKYGSTSPGFQPGGVFAGVKTAVGVGQSRDLVTTGNNQKKGYFFYDLTLYAANDKELGKTDPGGDNDPTPPSSGWPPG